MNIFLINFPHADEKKARTILVNHGRTVSALNLVTLAEDIEIDYTISVIFVYSAHPGIESSSIHQLLVYRFPMSTICIISPSRSPEDVRTVYNDQYSLYIFWTNDLKDFTEAVALLDNSGKFSNNIHEGNKYNLRMVSLPLERQLETDRILTSITDTSSNLASSYYPLLLRQRDLNSGNFAVCVIRLHLPLHIYVSPNYTNSHNILINQLKLHMISIEGITSPPFEIRKIIKDNQIICLFCSKEESMSVLENEVKRYLNDVNKYSQNYMNISILCGYSHPYSKISDTNDYYQKIVTNLDQGYYPGSQPVCMLDEIKVYKSFDKNIDDFIQKNLSIAIFNHDSDLLLRTLAEACDRFMEQTVMLSVAKAILVHAFIRFSQETDYYMIVNHEFVERRMYDIMSNIITFPLLKKFFSLIGEISSQAKKGYETGDVNRLNLAMQYIQKYYSRKISLESISKYLALNPNYFCGWFKSNTGENFGDMVIRNRVDTAKNLLLNSDKKISDIAEEVGYEEIVSFNRVFKKRVNMTPTQYRKSNLKISVE